RPAPPGPATAASPHTSASGRTAQAPVPEHGRLSRDGGRGGQALAPPCTNGGFFTSASTERPRTSIVTAVPSSTPRSSSASATPCSSVGENVPEVTSPTLLPSVSSTA